MSIYGDDLSSVDTSEYNPAYDLSTQDLPEFDLSEFDLSEVDWDAPGSNNNWDFLNQQATSSSKQQATSSSKQQATSSSKQQATSTVKDDDRLTYEDFFNKVQMYLNNDQSVKFTSAADKKMSYTILQTLERISIENALKNTLKDQVAELQQLLYSKLSQEEKKKENQAEIIKIKKDIHELTTRMNSSGDILQAYKNNAKIKVANSTKLEENKYKLGVQKRHKNRIFSLSDPELFEQIYETTEKEVFPVYELLWNAIQNKTPYGRDENFISAVRGGGDAFKYLENKTDKYLYGIYDEYESRSIEIHDMIQNGEFQMFEGKPYIYENQKLRLSQFTPKSNNPIPPKSPKAIKEEGHRYKGKIHAVFENMKSFILGGDDDIWREWYIAHGKKGKYDDLKNKWNSFVKEKNKEINIQIENNAIYLSKNIMAYVEPAKIGYTSLERFANNTDYDIDEEERTDNDIRLIQTVQKMLKSIYDDDLNMFKSHLFGKNHGNKHLTSYLSRYEIMKSDNNTIENDLKYTLDKDRIPVVLKKIDFMLFPKKAKRSRSLRIIPKNKDVTATPTTSPIETPPPNDGFNRRRKSPKKK